jgi:hypothetical protein
MRRVSERFREHGILYLYGHRAKRGRLTIRSSTWR